MKLSNLFNDCVRVAQGLRRGSARPAREWLKSMTFLALLLIIGVDSAWGDTSATYTVSTTTSVSSSGTAPTGSSASYSQDYTTAGQMTNGSKNSHLTLSGYDGKRIKGVSLSMRATNSRKGSITIKVGSTTICSSSGSVPTSTSFNSYVMTLSSNPTVGTNEKITIDISASGSSVFIQSYTITYDSPTMRTVTWYVNGEEYTTGSPSTSVADGGKVSTLPTTPSISCGGKSFVGWTTSSSYSNASIPPTVLFTDAADSPIISGNTNFYAIFANTVDNGSETSITGGNMANSLPSSWSGTNDGFYSGNGAKFNAVNQYVQSANISSNAYTSVTVKFKAGKNGSTGSVLTIATLDASSNVITSKTFSPSEEYNSQSTINALTLTAGTTIKYVRITMTTRVANVGMKYCEVFHPRYTYSNYATSCCTELASINGSVSWNSPTEAVITWNKLADQVTSWALTWSPNTAGSSITSAIADKGSTQKTATVSGLDCGTEYTFTLTPTTKSGVCTVTTDPTIVSTSTKYAIAKSATNGSFTTKVSSTAVTSTCDGSTVAIDATANNGYSFTSWTITNTSTSANVTSSVSLSSSTNKNATFTMPAYAVTVTAAFSCVTPTFGTNLSTATVEYTQGDVSTALTVGATANNATINYQWQTKVGSGEWTNTGTNAPGNTSITPSTSSAVTTQYRCIATNTACGSTATSNVATIQVNEPSCTAPTAVASSSPTSRGATLTVTDAYNTNKYDFYCSTSNDAPNNLTTPTASVSGSKEKAITGLDYAKTYYYWARTDCSGSTSGWFPESNPSTFTTTCPAPTSISAGSITTSGVTFTITDNNSPTIVSFGSGYGYEIYYSTTNSAPGASPSGTVTTTTTSKAVTGLTTGTIYYVWVRGYGPAAKSSWVSGGSFTVDILDHITITAPTKTTYFAGETFVSTGATVTAHYSPSETTAPVTGSATWTPTAALTTGNTTATASYTEQGVTKTANQTINVYSVTVNKVDEDGAAIDNANVTAIWTVGTKTLSASVGATNYVFKNWEFSGSNNGLAIASTTSASTSVTGTPTGNVTIKAVFYKPRTVTKGTGTGTSTFTVSPTGEVKYGSSVTVTCAATDGYKNPWTLTVTPSDGATYSSSGSSGSISITNITKDITVDLAYTDKGCTDHGASSITSGASTGYTQGPVDEFYKYSTRQIIYTKSDLGLAAGKKGTIKSISFQYAYGTAMTKKTDVDIYLANTNLTSLTTGSYVPYANFTKVYSGALNCSGNGTWNEFEFTTSFEYNGVGQLVVMIDDNSGDYDGMYYVFQCHSGVSGAQVYKRQDSGGDIDPETWTPANETDSRPNTKFCIEEDDMTPATVNWYVNGSIEHTQTDYPGTALTSIPTPDSEDCDGEKEFIGWYTDDYTHATVAPAFVNPTVIPEGGADYYAVFATVTPTNNYQQITSEGDLVAGAKYLIVGYSSPTYEALPVEGATSLTTVTVSSSTISNPGSTLIWTLEGSADAWNIKSTSNNKYLQISDGDLTFEASTSLTFSVGVSSSVFTFTSSAASGNKVLSYYASKNKFNAYTSPNNVYVFKQVINATNYATTCAETYDVNRAGTPVGTVTGGTFTVSPNRQAAGKTVNLSPTPDLGYSFGSWIVTKTEAPYTDITSTNVAGNTLTMPAFDVTVNATFTPTPTLTATGGDLSSTTLPFGTSCEQDEGTDKTFVLNGYSLTNNVTLTIGGTDASMFSVKSPSSPIDKGTGRINDQTVTVTFTPTSTGAKTATLTIASSGASSIVLTLSGTAIKHYKVHYWNSGTDVHQESVLAGADASATWDGVGDNDGCDTETYKYFVGWSKTNVGSTPTTTKPTIGGTYTSVSADVNYYAVWTNVNPGGWERYESSTLAEGDYLIVQKSGETYYTMKNSQVGSNPYRMDHGVAVFSGSLISAPSSALSYDLNDFIWHIAESSTSGYYTIYNADESKYVAATGAAKDIAFVASPADDKELFSFTYSSTYKTYNWTSKYNTDNSVNAHLRDANSGWACYAAQSNDSYLYYRAGGTAKYITNCCDKNVTLATNSPSHGSITFSPSGTISTCGADAATRQTTMTVSPDAGYYLSAWSTSGVTPYSVSPAIAYGSVSNSGAQATTVTFNQNTTTGTYTANATFTAIPVSSLSLRAQQTGQSDKVGNDLTMNCYPKEGQTGGDDPLNHTLKVLFEEVLPANALDKTYDWSVRVKATGDADWTAVGFTGNALNTNSILHTYNKSTGTLKIKATEGTAEIKITAHDGSGVNAKVTITVANVPMSSVSVSPTEMEVYAGQKKPVTVTFTPANATDRSYSAGSSYTYVNIQNKGASSFNIEGKTSVTDANHDETVTVTTTDGSKTATVDVTVKPLPKVIFVDNVHNESFANVIATVDDGGLTVTTTKPTPTHSDVSDPGASYNTCERQHLHLLGWIESTWADAHPNAEPGDITGAGAGNYYAAGADIDLVTQNNKTFYAVWTKIE